MVTKIVEAKLSRSEQPLLFLRMHIAQYKLVQGDLPGTKALIEAGKESLDSLPDVRSFPSLQLVAAHSMCGAACKQCAAQAQAAGLAHPPDGA